MIWSLSLDPLVPVWALALAGAVALALAGAAAVMRLPAWPLRAAAMAALVFALAGPAIEREDREPLTSIVSVVVDESQSQRLDGRDTTTADALEALETRISALPGYEIRVTRAARGEGAAADGTALFSALADSLSDVPPERIGGAVMITDGQVHDIPESAADLGFQAPLHALITGREDEVDRRLAIARAPKFALVGSEQVVTLQLQDRGPAASGERVRILVRRDGEVVAEQRALPGSTVDIPVEIAHGGDNIFEFTADPLAGELTDLNNRVVVTVEGIRENLRVLLVSGSPHAGERTWRNLLKSDASVDLVHFTILRPPNKQDGTPINELSLIAFPTRELFSVKIDEFDLIIFDRYVRRGVLPLLYFDNIARYVRDGGAVLVASGPDYADGGSIYRTPLSPVLPAEPTGIVYEEPFRAEISDTGTRHPVTRDLPGGGATPPDWSRWFRLVEANVANAETLMNGANDKPLLVLGREGEGRVAVLLSDHVWLWARGYEGGGPHVALLRRLAHWLMKEPDLEEEALRLTSRGPEVVAERQTIGENVGDLVLSLPGGETRTLTPTEVAPGLWRASTPAPDLGLYTVDDGTRKALVHVGPPNPREFTDVLSTTETLGPLSAETGGATRRIADAGGEVLMPRVVPLRRASAFSGDGWIGLRSTSASVLKGVDRYPLFQGLLGLALLLGVVSLLWYREGR
ncbi:membrane protein [Stappia stellulata]|uniref:membrane protein n=1 Tax=Stappia stellulata TaxID=71235 RepID=UPI0003FBEEE1|nr:membrane protein [Stappia stellulata]